MQGKEMLGIMLIEQDELNSRLSEKWYLEESFLYHRAVFMELAELMDCFNWEWWKKKKEDKENVIIELIDIWHFLMSWVLKQEYYQSTDKNMDMVVDKIYYTYKLVKSNFDKNNCSKDFILDLIEETMKYALDYDLYRTTKNFFELLLCIGLSIGDLFKYYIAKKTLNKFRWAMSYKHGTYNKMWNGEEDNKVMLRMVDKLSDKYKIETTHDYFRLYDEILKRELIEYYNKEVIANG